MNRKNFIKRFGMGVLACSMVKDALIEPLARLTIEESPVSAHYVFTQYTLGYKISEEMLMDDMYPSLLSPGLMKDWYEQYK